MSDLTQIVPTDRSIEILHPATGETLGVRVGLVSIDDDRLTKVKRAITDRRIHLDARGKSFKAEEIEDNRNQILFTAMTGWDWYNPTGKEGDKDYDADAMPDFNGDVPDFNRKNVMDVFAKLPWFADQINEAIGDTRAFFSNSKRN